MNDYDDYRVVAVICENKEILKRIEDGLDKDRLKDTYETNMYLKDIASNTNSINLHLEKIANITDILSWCFYALGAVGIFEILKGIYKQFF